MIQNNQDMDITVYEHENLLLFWGGPFSQWYPEYNEMTCFQSKFMIDNYIYSCAEIVLYGEKIYLEKR